MIINTFKMLFIASTMDRKENIRLKPLIGFIFSNFGVRGCKVNKKPICMILAKRPTAIITRIIGKQIFKNRIMLLLKKVRNVPKLKSGFDIILNACKVRAEICLKYQGPKTLNNSIPAKRTKTEFTSVLLATFPFSRASLRLLGDGASVLSSNDSSGIHYNFF
jgi:hypothetical protein